MRTKRSAEKGDLPTRYAALLTVLLLMLLAIGCGGPRPLDGAQSTVQPNATADRLDLATPLQLLSDGPRSSSGTVVNGSMFIEEWPHAHVLPDDSSAVFQPQGDGRAEMAYAIYTLNFAGDGDTMRLALSWAAAPEPGSGAHLWAGLADWQQNSWRWYDMPDPELLVVTPAARHLDGTHVALLLAVVGTQEVALERIELEQTPRGNWWMYGHDQRHTGRSPYNGPQSASLLWTYTYGDEVDSSPAIGAGGAVVAGTDMHRLEPVNPDGTPAWAVPFDTGGSGRCSPAIALDGTVYIGTWGGKLFAVNPDGTARWQLPFSAGDSIVSSPAIAPDGTIYFGSHDGCVYALKPDGSQAWPAPFHTDGCVLCSPAVGTDGTVYCGSDDGGLYAINADGTAKWEAPFQTGDCIDSAPTIAENGTIYFGSYDGNVYAVRPDGTAKWPAPFNTQGWVSSSPALGRDGTLYVGSWDGNLYAIRPDGTAKWGAPFETDGPIEGSPAVDASGRIYFGSHDSRVYAVIDAGDQAVQLWAFATGGAIHGGPALAASRTLYVGSSDNKLYAFGDPGSELSWINAVIDGDGDGGRDVGRWCCLDLDPDGNPQVAYCNATLGDLQYARQDGGGWVTETVDAGGQVGGYASLAIDSAGVRHVAYYDFSNTALKYARWDGSWATETVLGAEPDWHTGEYVSLALSWGERPSITCYNAGIDKQESAYWTDFGWQTYTGWDSRTHTETLIALRSDRSLLHMIYYRPDSGEVWAMHWADLTKKRSLLGYVGQFDTDVEFSLALGEDHALHSTYYLSTDASGTQLGDLIYCRILKSELHQEAVDTAGDVGRFSSIALGAHGLPHVAYYDATNDDLKYARFNGSFWDAVVIDPAGGEYCSLKLDQGGIPHVCYYARDTGDLKYATLCHD